MNWIINCISKERFPIAFIVFYSVVILALLFNCAIQKLKVDTNNRPARRLFFIQFGYFYNFSHSQYVY